jgi:signal transduction histidine kinase
VTWPTPAHAAVLFTSAALAVWAFVVVRGRRSAPGRQALGWLMLAVAHWSVTSGLHALVDSVETRIVLSQIQYLGIAAVSPFWLLFASQYARLSWTADPALLACLWVVPAVTVLLAWTNASHGLIWRDVVPAGSQPGARLIYVHGLWFWVAVTFNYAAMAAGALVLLRALRRAPLAHRRQLGLVVAGIALPWVANALYLANALPPGLDLTPVAFSISGSCILWGLYYHRLLTLVPIARDLVIESMDVGVIVLDARRVIVDSNPAARELTGCSDASVGRPIEDALPWWSRASAGDRAPAGLPVPIELGSRSLEVHVTAVRDSSDGFAGWLLMIRDVTLRRRADAERQALDRRILEQQRVESLSVLAGGVAHDFNNLLTGILGNADAVAKEAVPGSRTRGHAEAIVLGAQRAADLVEKMQAYAGEGRIAPQAVRLDAIVHEMCALLQATAARHCTIDDRDAGPQPAVTADPTQLRQVLLNLITNAAEAVPTGSIVTVSTGAGDLSEADLAGMTFGDAAKPGPHVFLQVSDTGPGIEPDRVRRVFDPFYSSKAGGRGLGLAAVQGIVRSHHGALELVSQIGAGTRVRVWLPMADSGGQGAQSAQGAQGA